MATKETEGRVTYSEAGTIGTTTTFVTVGKLKYGKTYPYPVVRMRDLLPEARERVLAYFDGETSKADNACEFGFRNRLAGTAAGKLRKTLVAPSAKSMRSALQDRVCKLLGDNDSTGATALYTDVQAADHDELVVLWIDHVQVNVEADTVTEVEDAD